MSDIKIFARLNAAITEQSRASFASMAQPLRGMFAWADPRARVLRDQVYAYEQLVTRCHIDVYRDPFATLGFVLFFAGAHRDAHSTLSRFDTPSETMTRHLNAFRGGDVIRYLVLLRVERLIRNGY